MKTKITFLFSLFFVLSFAQKDKLFIQNESRKNNLSVENRISDNDILIDTDNPLDGGTTSPNTKEYFHDTKGNLSIDAGGQLQYTLSIALPPAVKSVAPQIDLVYNSSSGDGIAGYGWGVSGMTSISRMGKTIESNNGKIENINLNYTDHYSFNGQRLILKSGVYGKNGAEYVAEKYSNVKIQSFGVNQDGTGPKYWVVTFEDGSQGFYGDYNGTTNGKSITPVDYNIVKWRDAQGNKIEYAYEKNNNVSRVKNIFWGGNDFSNKPNFNSIKFTYISNTDKEYYVAGKKMLQNKILQEISVNSNYNLFKKYKIDYIDKGTSYLFVDKITEFNSDNQPSNPVVFEYENNDIGTEELVHQTDITDFDVKKYADFNIDGEIDYIEMKNNQIHYKSSAYKSVVPVTLQYDGKFKVADLKLAVPITFKKNGYISNKIGLAIPVRKYIGSGINRVVEGYEIRVYSVDLELNKFVFEYSKLIPLSRYALFSDENNDVLNRTINGELINFDNKCRTNGSLLDKIYTYDYNGDGLTELILQFKKHKTCMISGEDGELDNDSSTEINNFKRENKIYNHKDISEHNFLKNSYFIDDNNTIISSRYNEKITPSTSIINEKLNKSQEEKIDLNTTIISHHYYSYLFVELDEEMDINTDTYTLEQNTGYAKELSFHDLNGDGIQEIIRLNNSHFEWVHNIHKNSTGSYSKKSIEQFTGQNLKGISGSALYGDYNGDRKTDILVPEKNNSTKWTLYISDGKKFKDFYLNNFIFFTTEKKVWDKSRHNTFFESSCTSYRKRFFQYTVGDLDNDGKSEIIVNYGEVKDHQWNAHKDREETKSKITVYSVNKLSGANNYADLYDKDIVLSYYTINGFVSTTINTPIIHQNPNAITTNSNIKFYKTKTWNKNYQDRIISFNILNINRTNQQIVLIGESVDCGNDCGENYIRHYNYTYLPKIGRIKSISQGGIKTNIEYKELKKDNTHFYSAVQKEAYPFFEIAKVPNSFVVSQLSQNINGQILKQNYLYRGFIVNNHGRGIVGFRKQARSTWYASGYEKTKVWTVKEMNPVNYGMPIKEWTVRTNWDFNKIFPPSVSFNSNFLLSLKTTEYKTDYLLNGNLISENHNPNVVKAIVPIKTIQKDFLKNIIAVSTITFNNEYLPTKTVNNINNNFSISTTNLSYYPSNTSVANNNYHVGRIKSKVEQMKTYGDTKGAKEEYIYENNLLKSIKTYNQDNTEWIAETYSYDNLGNVTKKIISNSENSNTKTNQTVYDSKGRFVIKKINHLGLENNITYNDWGQVLTQTDTFGNTLTNTYDTWGKLTKSENNLSGITTYEYERLSSGGIKVKESYASGAEKEVFKNKLGQTTMVRSKGTNQDEYVAKLFNYDALGRKTRESLPYKDIVSNNILPFPTSWNYIAYDDNVYPARVTTTSFNGKKVQTSISGNLTTTKELNGYQRTTTKTTDALGNIIKSTDKGGSIYFYFDANGQVIKTKYKDNIVTTKYDHWGRKSEFNDPSNGIYKYHYNTFGQPTLIESPKGQKKYFYNNLGQLIRQEENTTDGTTNTQKQILFTYNNKGMLIKRYGTSKGKVFSSNIQYDNATGRILSSFEESNGNLFSTDNIVYDAIGRIVSYDKELDTGSGSGSIDVSIKNVYNTWDGSLQKVLDKNTNKVLWELLETNAKGEILSAKLGQTLIDNTYDNNGFLSNITHTINNKTVLQLGYSFNAIKNELNSRTRGGDFNINETFTYDDNNRLVNWTNPTTGQMSNNIYDERGRITHNDQVGDIHFENTQKVYQPTGMTLNEKGTQNYNNNLIQHIVYNENNDPVFINGEQGDVAFEYGLTAMRQVAHYGGNFQQPNNNQTPNSKFTKYYSEDGSFELIKNHETGEEKAMIYIGGTPYESDIVYIKNFDETSAKYHFLHKDYLGSILAVTNEDENVEEQRHYNAWGKFTHLKIKDEAIITDSQQLITKNLIVDRGYTSHEHFEEVGIIHMNGRLYDPLLRRFLNADENIQAPYNTQNYNKYGYVMNNPLLYNDPSGEIFGLTAFVSAIIIGAAVGVVAYTVTLGVTGNIGNWSIGGAMKSMFFGAVGGAVSFGVGSLFSSHLTGATALATSIEKGIGGVGLAIVQAGTHAVSQGVLGLMQGQNFLSASLSGFAGSLGASAWSSAFGSKGVSMIAFGALSGGVASELSGGNFWQGAITGGIVAGLNHAMHKMQSKTLMEQEFEKANLDPNQKASFEDHEILTEKIPSLKTLYDATKPIFKSKDNLPGAKGKQVRGTRIIEISANKIGTLLDYSYTLGHEMLHLFDTLYNYSIIMKIVGKTTLGSHAFDYYKEYRAYTWEYNMGNNINVNNRLKSYNFSPSAISIVNKNIINLNLSVINP